MISFILLAKDRKQCTTIKAVSKLELYNNLYNVQIRRKNKSQVGCIGILQFFFFMLQTKVEITGRADEFQTLPKLEKQRICPKKALVCVRLLRTLLSPVQSFSPVPAALLGPARPPVA